MQTAGSKHPSPCDSTEIAEGRQQLKRRGRIPKRSKSTDRKATRETNEKSWLADQFRALEYENEVEEGIADARAMNPMTGNWLQGVAGPTKLTGMRFPYPGSSPGSRVSLDCRVR